MYFVGFLHTNNWFFSKFITPKSTVNEIDYLQKTLF